MRTRKLAIAAPDNTGRQQGQWRLGQSGNPAGRPIGSRNKFSEAFLADLLGTWEEHEKAALERGATNNPAVFLRVAASDLYDDELAAIVSGQRS